jgi:HEPN domain-containing protein
MPHDPEFVAETRAWMIRAHDDLRAAAWLNNADPPLRGDAVFHCQQAAERALKGFLTWHRRIFGKTHNIGELGRAVVEIAPDLADLLRRAAGLTDYAWRFRYPGEAVEPAPEEPAQALTAASEVYEAVLARLPEEVRP